MAKKKRNHNDAHKKDIFTAKIKEYDQQCVLYTDFTAKVEGLVRDLLKEDNLRIHSITSRIKNRAALRVKLDRSEEKYTKLSDVTDISGIRIITYLADEVDKAAKLIQQEFDIDTDHSVDKRTLLDPDRFGYLSLHYVVKLSPARLQLTEYQRFKGCKVEIQIRSILQHTWAEVEHDLGYKGKEAVPREIRRRFSRLAGLLELADDEFTEIRDSLLQYETSLPQRIIDAPASVLIDKASLWAFIKNSPLLKEIERKMVSRRKGEIIKDEEYVGRLVDKLHYVGLKTVADIVSSLEELGEVIVKFRKELIKDTTTVFPSGVSLFYLCYTLVARDKSEDGLLSYLENFELGPPKQRKSIAQRVFSAYKQAITQRK